jgi:hypothetical protein
MLSAPFWLSLPVWTAPSPNTLPLSVTGWSGLSHFDRLQDTLFLLESRGHSKFWSIHRGFKCSVNVCSLFVLFEFFCYLCKVTDGSQILVFFDSFSAHIACHILGILVADVINPLYRYKGLLRFCFKRNTMSCYVTWAIMLTFVDRIRTKG